MLTKHETNKIIEMSHDLQIIQN